MKVYGKITRQLFVHIVLKIGKVLSDIRATMEEGRKYLEVEAQAPPNYFIVNMK